MNYDELIADLRYCADTETSCSQCRRFGRVTCEVGLHTEAANAITALQEENKRLCTGRFVESDFGDFPIYGYKVRELYAFAALCRRYEIGEDDLHEFCTNVERGFKAGLEDLRITQENMIQRMHERLERDAQVFTIGPSKALRMEVDTE